LSKSHRCNRNKWNTEIVLQEIRWPEIEQLKVGKYIVYFSGMEEGYFFGYGFAVHDTLEPQVLTL